MASRTGTPHKPEPEQEESLDYLDDLDDLDDLGGDWIDPDLEAMPPNINWLRPFLMIGVIVFAGWVMTKFQTELSYFFSPKEPLNIGEATELKTNADGTLDIPYNRYVSLRGLPTRGSLSCDPAIRYFKLVGAHVYIESPIKEDLSPIACRALRKKPNAKIMSMPYFDGAGRVMPFEEMTRRYGGFMNFYEKNYEDRFCAFMTEAKKQARLQFLQQLHREKYKAEKGSYPSDGELERLVGQEKLCHHAVLIQSDQPPSSYWPYLLIYIVLGLIMVWNVYLLVQWIRRTRELMA